MLGTFKEKLRYNPYIWYENFEENRELYSFDQKNLVKSLHLKNVNALSAPSIAEIYIHYTYSVFFDEIPNTYRCRSLSPIPYFDFGFGTVRQSLLLLYRANLVDRGPAVVFFDV